MEGRRGASVKRQSGSGSCQQLLRNEKKGGVRVRVEAVQAGRQPVAGGGEGEPLQVQVEKVPAGSSLQDFHLAESLQSSPGLSTCGVRESRTYNTHHCFTSGASKQLIEGRIPGARREQLSGAGQTECASKGRERPQLVGRPDQNPKTRLRFRRAEGIGARQTTRDARVRRGRRGKKKVDWLTLAGFGDWLAQRPLGGDCDCAPGALLCN